MTELRAACEHGKYDDHFDYDTDEPCPGGHPVEGGEKVWWCEEHDSNGYARGSSPWCHLGVDLGEDSDCRMVERCLIPLPNSETEK